MLIEIILWAALVFFLWTLRDNLGDLESELQEAQAMKSREIAARALSQRFVKPEVVDEPIGRYRDATIHARIGINGKQYRFDYVCPPVGCPPLRPDQCCIAPGIVYVRYDCQPVATQDFSAGS
jgi:hypothetical protein